MSQQVDLEELTRLYDEAQKERHVIERPNSFRFAVKLAAAFPALRDELVRLRERDKNAEAKQRRAMLKNISIRRQLDEAKGQLERMIEVFGDRSCDDDCKCSARLALTDARAFLASLAGKEDSEDYSKAFESLGRVIYDKVTYHVGCEESDEWCDDVMTTACLLGLAKKEIYNPDKHGSLGYEPGVDSIFWWGHLPKHWRPVEFLDVSGNPQAPDKCGFLRINDAAAISQQPEHPTQGEVKQYAFTNCEGKTIHLSGDMTMEDMLRAGITPSLVDKATVSTDPKDFVHHSDAPTPPQEVEGGEG